MHPRLTPANGHVALASMRGELIAERYTDGQPMQVSTPLADMLRSPGGALDCQVLGGAGVLIIDGDDMSKEVFCQAIDDGYVGYMRRDQLKPPAQNTHKIVARGSHIYRQPDLKSGALAYLSFGVRIVGAKSGGGFLGLTGGGYVPLQHVNSVDQKLPDYVAVTERFLGVPYLWGGNSTLGIDCSGVVQVSLQAVGVKCGRDTDMQEGFLGEKLSPDIRPRRGDLVFWGGHVGVMQNETQLIHANAFHMAVASEPRVAAIARIVANGGGAPTSFWRLSEALCGVAIPPNE